MAEAETYCECCGKPMQILYTREYVENAVKEERESIRDMDVSLMRAMIEGARGEAFPGLRQYVEALEEFADNIGCLEAIRKMRL